VESELALGSVATASLFLFFIVYWMSFRKLDWLSARVYLIFRGLGIANDADVSPMAADEFELFVVLAVLICGNSRFVFGEYTGTGSMFIVGAVLSTKNDQKVWDWWP